MGHAGRDLADRRQLLGAQHLALALLELLDDAFDLGDDALKLTMQVGQVALLLEGDRTELPIEPAGRIADADAQLVNGVVQAPGHGIAQQQAAQGRSQPDSEEAPVEPAYDALAIAVRALDLAEVEIAELLAFDDHILVKLL